MNVSKEIMITLLALFSTLVYSQVGIGTTTPDASALLEVSSTNKGFKGPDVKLLNKKDITTIKFPEPGLLVFNTQNAGTYPNNVIANEYYFWNGTEWVNIASYQQIEELLVPGLYALNETTTQTVSPDINNALEYQQVVFSTSTPIVNKGNIVTKSGNLFTIRRTGLYEVSAHINYNPAKAYGVHVLSLLNISIQKRIDPTTWEDLATARRSWGNNTSELFQTAFVPNTCVYLEAGDVIRLAIANPTVSDNLGHGTNARIATSANAPVSKSITIQLLNY